jgi:cephalosporin hydroxylase
MGLRCWYESKNTKGLKVLACQEKVNFDIMGEIVEEEKPEMIIEFGSMFYGMTLFFHELDLSMQIESFDLCDPRLKRVLSRSRGKVKPADLDRIESVFSPNVHLHRGNIFLEDAKQPIRKLAHSSKKKIMFCDNGKKPMEVKMYGVFINRGDIMMVHDWPYEIDYHDIWEELKLFEPHPANFDFRKKKSSARAFIRL